MRLPPETATPISSSPVIGGGGFMPRNHRGVVDAAGAGLVGGGGGGGGRGGRGDGGGRQVDELEVRENLRSWTLPFSG